MQRHFESTAVDAFVSTQCVICCKDTVEALTKLSERGAETLLDFCSKRSATCLYEYLLSQPSCVYVHNSCRKRFTDPRTVHRCVADDEFSPASKRLRSTTDTFSWKEMCFFCGEVVVSQTAGPSEFRRASTIELRDNVLKQCDSRLSVADNDSWALQVQSRLRCCCDLVAEEAVYHVTCYSRFASIRGQDVHVMHPQTTGSGRPEDPVMLKAFDKLCDWLEVSAEQDTYTLTELQQRMTTYVDMHTPSADNNQSTDNRVYSMKHLKRKLIEKYGDHICFATVAGRKDVVCFSEMCSFIVSQKWYNDKKDASVADKSERIVLAAAKLIAAQIRETDFDKVWYPSTAEMVSESSAVIPTLLQMFLSSLITCRLKQRSLGQAIVQAARPRSVIAPLLLGLALDIDLQHGSESLTNKLSHLGMCMSYDETVRYKQAVMMSQPLRSASSACFPTAFTQWVGDNVDHNVRTLDGHDTFHGLGVISVSTSLTDQATRCEAPVRRLKRLPSAAVTVNRSIPIQHFTGDVKQSLASVTMKPVCHLKQPVVLPPIWTASLVWHVTWFFSKPDIPRPNWSGYMQTVSDGDHSKPAVVDMKPLIDIKPTDNSCIYSTLVFACEQAQQLNVVASITFDQPLWLKAYAIAHTANLDIVCRLGGFHTLMSFLGSVGSVMAGSGLDSVLQQIYGPDTVAHILQGKAYARAVRGHFLIESALMSKLLKFILPVGKGNSVSAELDSVDRLTDDDMLQICSLVETVWEEKLSASDCSVLQCTALQKVEEQLQSVKCQLCATSRTARLWIQYIDYISIVKQFILAERTGNWHLHLTSVSNMLNLFAATGRLNYAKSARLYLQSMVDLPDSHPWLYEMYSQYGLHSVRQSDRYWAGLSTDLMIEQTMMKAIKGRGGLTRGRGLTESVRTMWVSTAHKLADIHLCMTAVAGKVIESEHTDVGAARAARDSSDLEKLLSWLDVHDPFLVSDSNLRNISTGVTASDSDKITCDVAEEVGAAIQTSMDNHQFSEIVLKKCDQVRTLAVLQKTHTGSKQDVIANSSALFHRLIVLIERSSDVQNYFMYEMTPVPTSIFRNGYMRKPNKAALARCLTADLSLSVMPDRVCYVVDGGTLLRKVKWLKGITYGDVVQQYVDYVIRRYGHGAHVVFDGYAGGPSVKDHEHQRRASKVKAVSPDVSLNATTPVVCEQESFLANDNNKDKLIKLLMLSLRTCGINTIQSSGDADVDIASTALTLASSQEHAIAVVADDTDILVLLVHHFHQSMSDIFFVARSKRLSENSDISIRSVCQKLGHEVCQQLLVIHAVGGCDTTSALYGIGKATVFRRITAVRANKHLVHTMQNENANKDEVIAAGLSLMVRVYGGKPADKLNKMRHEVYL